MFPAHFPRCLNVLHDALSKAVGARTFLTHTDIRSFAEKDFCGLCAVHWIDHRARGKPLPTTTDEVHYLHDVARAQYMDFLQTQSSVPRPWIWAAGLDISAQRRLLALLEQHGVPSAQAEGRSQMIVQSLGAVEVQNAMTSSNPWRLLKGIANRQKPPLKLVLPEELEVMIRANKHKIETVGRKKGEKGKGIRACLLVLHSLIQKSWPLKMAPLLLATDRWGKFRWITLVRLLKGSSSRPLVVLKPI